MKTGRPAKPPDQRVNRNRPTHETVVLPASGRSGRVPRPLGGPLKGEEGRLWRQLWHTPEATQWGDTDVAPLTRLVVLSCDREAWRDSKLLAEMRNLEDRYGCSVYARRVNKLVHEDTPEEAPSDAEAVPVRRLHAVDRALEA